MKDEKKNKLNSKIKSPNKKTRDTKVKKQASSKKLNLKT
jgi:hypothetical protein